jgi:RNA polymerase sigma-70 factor (ECF subfamily)
MVLLSILNHRSSQGGSCAEWSQAPWKVRGWLPSDPARVLLTYVNTAEAHGSMRKASGKWKMRELDPFRTLYDANHERIRRFLVRLVGPQDCEDLTQIVFEKSAKGLSAFRGDAEISTWLHRIAANAASDWLRSRSVNEAELTTRLPDASEVEVHSTAVSMAELDGHPSAEEQLAEKDTQACIRGEIGKLSDDYREVLMLSSLGDLSDDEVAQTLGITKGNAKVRLHRARQEFRKIIEARCDFYRNELSCKPSNPDCCSPPASSDSH